MKGIDVSSYQGTIDWAKVKKEGYKFAIIRLGIGDNIESQDDTQLRNNINGCKKNGIPYAFYLVSYAERFEGSESVQSEIAHTQRLIQGTNPFAIFYDMEIDATSNLGKGTLTNFAIKYCDYFKNLGYQVGVYANKNWFTNYLDYNLLKSKGYKIWLAHYGVNQPGLDCDIWQYTDKGVVSGITANTVDLNIMYNNIIGQQTTNNGQQVATSNKNVNVYYKVKTQAHGWLPEVKNLEDYAGWENSPITGVAIKVDKGSIKYRVHLKGKGWLSYVTGYNTNDIKNGYAGTGKDIIDAIEVYYYTPDNIRPYKKAKYKVNNYPYQYDNEKNNEQDGYAGVFGVNVTKFQIVIE